MLDKSEFCLTSASDSEDSFGNFEKRGKRAPIARKKAIPPSVVDEATENCNSANTQKKDAPKISPSRQVKPQQKRVPWSQEEEQALKDGIR